MLISAPISNLSVTFQQTWVGEALSALAAQPVLTAPGTKWPQGRLGQHRARWPCPAAPVPAGSQPRGKVGHERAHRGQSRFPALVMAPLWPLGPGGLLSRMDEAGAAEDAWQHEVV